MSKLTIGHEAYSPENVFAGDFPVLTDSVTVGTKAIKRFSPVKLVNGVLEPVAKGADDATAAAGLYGIAADDADAGAPGVIYLTGEFFASGLVWPAGVTAATLKGAFRTLNIYLK